MTPDLSPATALALLALDPALGGAVFWGADGWALEPWAAALAALRGPEARVLRLPLDAGPAQILGGLDLAASLRTGRRVPRPGLLATHDGGVLWLPDPDLLPADTAGPLTTALRQGAVQLERDGVSTRLPARLLLLTTAAPGAPPRYPALLAQAGLWVPATGALYADPPGDLAAWVAEARTHLPVITPAEHQIAALAAVALRLGVPGLRTDYIAARAARAAAALAGRAIVDDADLELAVALVLAPRATLNPAEAPEPPPPPAAEPPAPEPASGDQETAAPPPEDSPAPDSAPGPTAQADRLIAAQAAALPPNLLPAARSRPSRNARGAAGAGRAAGERVLLPARHGRPGPAHAREHRPPGADLDFAATWEAAILRHLTNRPAGQRELAHEANGHLRLQTSDLRWRTPQAPAGVLFVLAVDASGSMVRNRLGAAKGAALLLLERAYRHRDRVALIAVRGSAAQVLLPPTRSLARARHLLDSLPAGGGTPLASALAQSWDLAARAALTGYTHSMLVLLTDGRANVPLAAPATPDAIAAEVEALASRWATLAATGQGGALVIDTRLRYLGAGAAPALARALGGRYLYLPQATAQDVGRAAEATARTLGWRGAAG
jgi:magnesium chelatase subunit D